MPPKHSSSSQQRKASKPVFAPSKAFTDPKPRLTFASSGLSTFREYNDLYERWLEARYQEGLKIQTTYPPHLYDVFLTEVGHSMRLDGDSLTTAIARRLQERAETPGFLLGVSWIWRDLSREKREELVLAVWEDQCRRLEATNSIWEREGCPELTLEWAVGFDEDGVGNWIRLWERQGWTKEEEEKSKLDKDALPYRNLRNEKWDRVTGVFEIEQASFPVKKSIRAFVHDGIGRRNYQLRQFVEELYAQFYEIPMVDSSFIQRSKAAKARIRDELDMFKNMQAEGANIDIDWSNWSNDHVFCAQCGVGDNAKPVTLRCSRCESRVKRIVRYCSKECQHQHWSIHKKVCGKALSTVQDVPSLALSERSKATPPTRGDLATSIDKLSLVSKYPSWLRAAWGEQLYSNKTAYWVCFRTEARDYDPRKPIDAYTVDLPTTARSRLALRRLLRAIALAFVESADCEDEGLDLAIVIAHLHHSPGSESLRQLGWIAKLIGREGEEIDRFVENEVPGRLANGLRLVETTPEYRLIKEYLADQAKPSSGSGGSLCTVMSVIREDLDNDPEAIWYHSHPAHPELTILECCVRIAGPELAGSDSKFAESADPLLLTKSLRKHIFNVLDDPRKDSDALGILMLAISGAQLASSRQHRWYLRRTSLDLGVPELILKREMERMRIEVETRAGEEWEMIREALRLLAGDKSNFEESVYPPLSSYS